MDDIEEMQDQITVLSRQVDRLEEALSDLKSRVRTLEEDSDAM